MFSQQGFFFPNEPGIYKIIQTPQKDNKNQDNQPQPPRPFSLTVNQQEFASSLGYSYVYVDEGYKEPPKLYGNVDERANYIWNNFVRNAGSSGALFTGKRGSGKSILAKHLANIAISKGLKVFVVAELRIEKKLISFISNLNNCVIFIDEFYKVIGWQYQDDFLSLMSDGNKKRLFILTENDTSNINRYILDRPERIRYHYEYSTLDPNIIREFCQDHNVPMDFENQLLKLNMSNKNFCFDHLQALVTEAINSGRWDLEWLISILNVKSLKMKEIKRPVKVSAMDNPEIFLDLEPSAIKDDLGLVKIGNAILNTNYKIWDDLKNNRTVNEAAIANYESSKSTIDHFEEKMELMDKIAKQASNLDTEGLGGGDNTRFRPVFRNNGNEEAPIPPSNIIKVNFSSEFMIGMEGDMYIYTDVTGEFKVYIENKKLVF